MPHGAPDGGIAPSISTVYSISDVGELAARLDSIDTFDRRGNVIALDGMENIITQWELQDNLLGQSIAQDNTISRNGSNSLKLGTGSSGSGIGQVYRYFPLPVFSRVGMEISFTLNTADIRVFFGLFAYDGSNYNSFFMRYHADEEKLYYLDNTSTYQALTLEYALKVESSLFHTLKMVGDFTTNYYVRALLDSQSFDLSTYQVPTVTSSTNPHLIAVLGGVANPVAGRFISFDDFILTQNEP